MKLSMAQDLVTLNTLADVIAHSQIVFESYFRRELRREAAVTESHFALEPSECSCWA